MFFSYVLLSAVFLVLCVLMAKKIILSKIAQQLNLIPGSIKVILVISLWFSVVFVK